MTKNIITPEKTAITNGISTTCKMISTDFKEDRENIKVLDYGCGRLRNTKYLLKEKFDVSIIDTPTQIENQSSTIKELSITSIYDTNNIPKEKFNIILCSFVLNVIPDKKDRDNVLYNISELLEDNGVAYIEVRDDKFVKTLKNKETFNDGLLTGEGKRKTFQKPYSLEEFKDYLNNFPFNIEKIKKSSNSIIAILKKKEA